MEYINSIVTILVGFFVFIVYWLNGVAERRNAAAIVVMDVRHAEQVVIGIIERNSVDLAMKDVMYENNWAKYKHLFVGVMSTDEFLQFNRFFDSCVDIHNARKRMFDVFHHSLLIKAQRMQEGLLDIGVVDSDEKIRKKSELIECINAATDMFDPLDPKHRIIQAMQVMGRISGSTGFEKIRKIARIE